MELQDQKSNVNYVERKQGILTQEDAILAIKKNGIQGINNSIILGDCIEFMKQMPNECVDAVICDLPYGTTACSWDKVIPFEPMWEQLKRITKKNGAIVLFGNQPFTSALVMSNPKMFKYEWVWTKNRTSGFAIAKYQPLKNHENVIVFAKGKTTYNPIMEERDLNEDSKKRYKYDFNSEAGVNNVNGGIKKVKTGNLNGKLRYPTTSKRFLAVPNVKMVHPTQKPVKLYEYLQLTYTNEGETILDFTSGSGTCAIAADNLKRNWICIEKDQTYYEISKKRINENRIKLNAEGYNLPLIDIDLGWR